MNEIKMHNSYLSIDENVLRNMVRQILKEEKDLKFSERKRLVRNILGSGTLGLAMVSCASPKHHDVAPSNVSIEQPIVANPVNSIDLQTTLQTKSVLPLKQVDTDVIGATNYAAGKTKLTKAHIERLDKIINSLPNKNVELKISGHSDSVGTYAQKHKVSQLRADYVAMYFKSKGFNNISTGTKVDANLIDLTDGPSWANRRVDVQIIADQTFAINLPPLKLKAVSKTVVKKDISTYAARVKKRRSPIVVVRETIPPAPVWEQKVVQSSNDKVLTKVGTDPQGNELFFDGNDTMIVRQR